MRGDRYNVITLASSERSYENALSLLTALGTLLLFRPVAGIDILLDTQRIAIICDVLHRGQNNNSDWLIDCCILPHKQGSSIIRFKYRKHVDCEIRQHK